jgi:biopolymer transport protein TolQ
VTLSAKIVALEAVKLASGRSAVAVHSEMKRGLNSLATIAATAPFVGIFGTLFGIVDSFPGMDGEQSTLLAMVEESLSESLIPTELGLLVAMLAFCSYKYFLAKLEDCDVEMESASLQLVNDLASTRFY